MQTLIDEDQLAGLPPEEREKLLAQAAQLSREATAGQRANADPLPGPLAEAFTGAKHFGDITVRPMVHYDFVLLRKLDSPLIRHLAELNKPQEERQLIAYTDDDAYVMAYQFIIPVQKAREEIERGVEYFRARAMERLAYNPEVPLLAEELVPEITANFIRAFATVVKYKSPDTKSGAEVFTPPPPAPKTASAGGSITSAA